eukprot:m.76991 g.76991  ORF g.76991 m.76991 type:complete len:412 (-) comp24963_c0_seq1:42-1277(-)
MFVCRFRLLLPLLSIASLRSIIALDLFSNSTMASANTTTSSSSTATCEPTVLDVLIVGGGLSGLVVASGALDMGLTFAVVEASDRLGGRLRNAPNGIDLGGAWVWPMHGQTKVKNLLRKLKIETFPQHGDVSTTRVVGGTFAMIERLSQKLQAHDPTAIKLRWAATSIVREGAICKVTSTVDDTTSQLQARHVVLAAPPRLLAERVTFTPALTSFHMRAMRDARTWMAGVTKVVVVYPTPFWRNSDARGAVVSGGLGGKSASQPAFQVYDGSSEGNADTPGAVFALTYFALLEPHTTATDATIAQQCTAQLADMWQRAGANPVLVNQLRSSSIETVVQRWPQEQWIADEAHPKNIHPHPFGVPALATTEWGGTLLFAGTESDQESPGVIEGAVGAAHRVLSQLKTARGESE